MTRNTDCYATHAALVEHAWDSLELCRNGRRFMPDYNDDGTPCLLEMANCPCCHSTLGRRVPLMSVAEAEAEALRVFRFQVGSDDAVMAAFELRSEARVYFKGDDE